MCKKYVSPQINIIKLDNDVSLQLESVPPIGPNEDAMQATPNHFNSTLTD